MRNRKRYPREWPQLSRKCKERANWICQKCGVEHGAMRISRWTLREYTVYMQAAHVRHNPQCKRPELACVCPTCHWHYFRKHTQLPGWYIEKLKHQKLIAQAYLV